MPEWIPLKEHSNYIDYKYEYKEKCFYLICDAGPYRV